MSKKPIILNLRSYSPSSLADFAQLIHDNLAISTVYLSPVPSLPVFQAIINKVRQANLDCGGIRSRGSHESFTARDQAIAELSSMLFSLANYCMISTPNNKLEWMKVGFIPKKPGSPVGVLWAVQELHQYFKSPLKEECIKLKWKKPLGAPKWIRISYKVMRSHDEHFEHAVEAGITTRTSFVECLKGLDRIQYYWVVPVNAYGAGARSNFCIVGLNRLY